MKVKIAVILLVVIQGWSSFGQLSEILDETWYLRSIYDGSDLYYVPYPESFVLGIDDIGGTYSILTSAVENGLGGTVIFDTVNETMEFTEVNITLLDCIVPNCFYEDLYFYTVLTDINGTLKTLDYHYFEFSNGVRLLRLTDTDGNSAEYLNDPIGDPNPALFRTWYLHSMDADLGDTSYIADFDPPIQPTLVINPDLTFSGLGSCNTFSGLFGYSEDYVDIGYLLPLSFDETGATCTNHDGFEQYYFDHFEPGTMLFMYVWENIPAGTAGLSFEMSPGFTFNFRNEPVLSLEDNALDAPGVIYPNPVNDKLNISNPDGVETIEIYTLSGKLLLQSERNIASGVDVSSLPPGMYLISVVTAGTSQLQKFIKQ